jgi:acyl-CoA thioesterase FadM/phosphopantetheinyl transferase
VLSDLLNAIVARTGFPESAIAPSARLLDDLNLDSIKAGELIAGVAARHGVAGRIEPVALSNATVQEIASAIEHAARPASSNGKPVNGAPPKKESFAPPPRDEGPSWVRSFRLSAVPAKSEPIRDSVFRPGLRCTLASERIDDEVALALAGELAQRGVAVTRCAFEEIANHESTWLFAVLPRRPQGELLGDDLATIVTRLSKVARCTIPNLVFVQRAGGYLGQRETAPVASGSAVAFAASLHHERPNARIRVIDLSPSITASLAAHYVLDEVAVEGSFAAVGRDGEGGRWVLDARPIEPVDAKERAPQLGPNDVVLVTGGARGITAACTLALARATGARMALVGRSQTAPEGSLEAYEQAGLTARYFACDVANRKEVDRLVSEVATQLGPITAVIHGAGLNVPRRADQVTAEVALEEVRPKLEGALHLLAALSDRAPRLFVALTSIIGVSGMPGNAWYAFANEALSSALLSFAFAHPNCSTLGIAYSVWDEIGMGARMGSIERLARMNIAAIPPAQGVEHFLNLVRREAGSPTVIVSARLGGLDTWPQAAEARPEKRFTQDVRSLVVGVEVVTRSVLSVESDPYLLDHDFQGSLLFPTVFGLEAMAQVVALVAQRDDVDIVELRDIELSRPIPVDRALGHEIEVRALAIDGRGASYRAEVRSSATGFSVAHFAATFVLAQAASPVTTESLGSNAPLAIDPSTQLYGPILFQGPSFQRLRRVHALAASTEGTGRCEFTAELRSADRKATTIGDPFFRDTLLQIIQVIIPQDLCLPIAIQRLCWRRPAEGDAGERRALAILERREGREYVASVVAFDAEGIPFEALSGYRLRILKSLPERPTARELIGRVAQDETMLRGVLNERATILDRQVPAVALAWDRWHELSREERHIRTEPLVERAARLAELEPFAVRWDEKGRPTCDSDGDVGVSVSHDDSLGLVVVGPSPQGCDIVEVKSRAQGDWLSLIGQSKYALLLTLVSAGDTEDIAGARVWAANEALIKARGSVPADMVLVERSGDGVILSSADNPGLEVLTFTFQPTRGPKRVVAVTVEPAPPTKSIATERPSGLLSNAGPQGQPVFVHSFPITFAEACSPLRKVHFVHVIQWLGKVRELALRPILGRLAELFSSGEHGWVTNIVELEQFSEISQADEVEIVFFIDEVSGQHHETTRLVFDIRRRGTDGNLTRAAVARLMTTWVKVLGHGQVARAPHPPDIESYLSERWPRLALPTTLVPLPERLKNVDLGDLVSGDARVLAREVFETGVLDANLVGNVYFSRYAEWLGRTRDKWVAAKVPEHFRPGTGGELWCGKLKVEHLREAMPHDTVAVSMRTAGVFERGVELSFEFHRVKAGEPSLKLAVATQQCVWIAPRSSGVAEPAHLPPALLAALTATERAVEESARP